MDSIDQREFAKHWLRDGLVKLEARLAGDPETGHFCHGDTPTMADLCLMSHVFAAKGSGVPTSTFPNIERIADACMAIDAFAAAAPMLQQGAPVA